MKKDKHLLKIVRILARDSFSDSKLVEAKVTRAIKTLKALPRSKAIFAIQEFLIALKRKEREHTLYIEATQPLSGSQIQKLKQVVEKKESKLLLRKKITRVLVNLNPQVLGGIRLKVGDEIWDETVAGKITQIKEAIRS